MARRRIVLSQISREVMEIIGADDGLDLILCEALQLEDDNWPHGGRRITPDDLRALPADFPLRLVESREGTCSHKTCAGAALVIVPDDDHVVGDAMGFVLHDGRHVVARYVAERPMFHGAN
jgi:hypothetical protein